MTAFQMNVENDRASVTVDNRFLVEIRRNAPPPADAAQMVLQVYPILDGEIWDDPYDVFTVGEGRIIELENEIREARQ